MVQGMFIVEEAGGKSFPAIKLDDAGGCVIIFASRSAAEGYIERKAMSGKWVVRELSATENVEFLEDTMRQGITHVTTQASADFDEGRVRVMSVQKAIVALDMSCE